MEMPKHLARAPFDYLFCSTFFLSYPSIRTEFRQSENMDQQVDWTFRPAGLDSALNWGKKELSGISSVAWPLPNRDRQIPASSTNSVQPQEL